MAHGHDMFSGPERDEDGHDGEESMSQLKMMWIGLLLVVAVFGAMNFVQLTIKLMG